jgi:hypothetical protein
MATPEYVPVKPMDDVRVYESPPRRPDPWKPVRPGDLGAAQPKGGDFGNPGPDQGYALRLADLLRDRLHLTKDDHWHDVRTGCMLLALKRASMFGRAPVIHDLKVAFTIWGYCDENELSGLVELRRPLFAALAHGHHYQEQRRLVNAVPDEVLTLTPAEVTRRHAEDWRSLLSLEQLHSP